MNVFHVIRMWKALRQRRRYDTGWGWAAGELLHGHDAEKLLGQVEAGTLFQDRPDPFDAGARAAIRTWELNVEWRRTK